MMSPLPTTTVTSLIFLVTSYSMTSAMTVPPSGYKAAVYAHRPILPPTGVVNRQQAVEAMMKNLRIFEEQAKSASRQGAHIIVFPEDGLYGVLLTRSVIRTYLEPIPDPLTTAPWVPCADPHRVQPSDVLTFVSCMARNNSMYVVVNMGDIQQCGATGPCPPDGHFQFNTDVVFDPKGQLVARYHKRTLFGEEMFDPGLVNGTQAERVTFETPFGRFGVFTCFDILFYDPAVIIAEQGVKNFVFPTAWMDSYPFLDAVGFHSAWARRHGATFLAANIQMPEYRFSGSGVYSARGPLGYMYNKTAGSPGTLVVVDVPASAGEKDEPHISDAGQRVSRDAARRTSRDAQKVSDGASTPTHVQPSTGTGAEDVHGYASVSQAVIRRDTFNVVAANEPSGVTQVCMNSTCCSLHYTRQQRDGQKSLERFALGAFQGVHASKRDWYFEACVLVRCTGTDMATCGALTWDSDTLFAFNLTGRFTQGASKYIYPEVLVSNNGQVALPPSGEWTVAPQGILSTRSLLSKPLLAAALYARDYSKDPPSADRRDDLHGDYYTQRAAASDGADPQTQGDTVDGDRNSAGAVAGFAKCHNSVLCIGSVVSVVFLRYLATVGSVFL